VTADDGFCDEFSVFSVDADDDDLDLHNSTSNMYLAS